MNKKFISLLWAINEVVDISDWEMEDLAQMLSISEEEIKEIFSEAAEQFYDLDD